MAIPLDKLLQKNRNIYELTCAIIKRTEQLTVTGAKEIEEEGEKIVGVGMKQILNSEIGFCRKE